MRARFYAFLILILIIGLPVGVYYYFTTKEIARITISVGTGTTFTVHLLGSFGVDGLPLADKILSYQQDCFEICTISPILPARYGLTLTSSGKVSIVDTVLVNTANTIKRSYVFVDDIRFESIGDDYDMHDIASGSLWHIRTETGSFVSMDGFPVEDIRFTDAIDLSPEIRLGYIDRDDIEKLKLSNFPIHQSVLIRLNRLTGESLVVGKDINIQAMFSYRGQPVYRDTTGTIFAIK